ncbi:alpha/beta hydrolase [Salipiger sp. P9]|uniref:alpha/beta fold hydrolase n=1 Tax=Salipiger pentaromativorans TaxID=2943193 RepID=UPI00215703F6|nr:alpha/beta hydrolase [Salipiger pentaromativorans]MCR8546319.1 alpha/beta hydrolase [Salipiger pentaromativorans]
MTQSSAQQAAVNGQTIAYDIAGNGPPLLLLHGYPQCRALWRPVFPLLTDAFTVIAPDLRGYGDSSMPDSVEAMSFRAMAEDMLALMDHLGFGRFHLAGHDRGARVSHRLALDAPDRPVAVSLLDIVPTHHLLSHCTQEVARAYYHWFFLAQPAPFPETLIGHDPQTYFERCLLGFGKAALSDFDPELLAEYRRAWAQPGAIRAGCNDYRAAIDVDFHHDAADLGRRVECPAQVLYGAEGAMARLMDVPATWADRLARMEAQAIPGGHFFPDQSPRETAEALRAFHLKHAGDG